MSKTGRNVYVICCISNHRSHIIIELACVKINQSQCQGESKNETWQRVDATLQFERDFKNIRNTQNENFQNRQHILSVSKAATATIIEKDKEAKHEII